MARSYVFPKAVDKQLLSKTAEALGKQHGFGARYFQDRVVLSDGRTEYRLTPHEIAETGTPNTLYEGLKSALTRSGVAHG